MHIEEKHKVADNFVCTKCPETHKDVGVITSDLAVRVECRLVFLGRRTTGERDHGENEYGGQLRVLAAPLSTLQHQTFPDPDLVPWAWLW